jgi:putative MATE family efflux protein
MQHRSSGISLLSLSAPIMLENTLRMAMGTVNVFMLGRYSDNAVGAVGVANQMINMILMIYSVAASGAAIVSNQYLGAGRDRDARHVGAVAVWMSAAMGLILSALTFVFAESIMVGMNLPPELLADGTIFLRIVGGTSFIQAMTATMSAVARSHGMAKLPMLMAFFMNVINLVGNWFVIYQPIPLPVSGVMGVACAQVVAAFCGFLLMVWLLTGKVRISLSFQNLFPTPRKEIGQILRVGLPAGIEFFSYSFAQMMSTYLVSMLGAEAITARVYVQNIVFFVSVFALSVGQASQIMVGHLVGSGRMEEANRCNWRNLRIAIAANAGLSLLAMVFRRQLLGIFTENPEIIRLGAMVLVVDFLVEIGRGMNVAQNNALRGAGDVRFPMLVAISAMWSVGVMSSWLLGIVAGLGLVGIWLGFALDEWVRGIIVMFRWKSGKWRTMRIVEKEG